MYYLLKFIQFILKNIPRKAGYFIFESFFTLNLLLPSKRKETLKKNLSHVLGHRAPDAMVREVYRNYGRYYFDLYYSKQKIFPFVAVSSEFEAAYAISKKLLENGRGLIIASLHAGSWDFAASYIARMYPGKTNVVVEKLSPPVFKWFTETRESSGIKVIAATDTKKMLRALKNNEVLVLVTDRDLEKAGYKMDFFGKKAFIPSGPAKMALSFGTPLMIGAMTRDRNNPFEFLPFFDAEVLNAVPMERTEENTFKLTQQLVTLMEKYISEYPEQWCMLQQVWVEDETRNPERGSGN
jgi:KDO2-lipid IV(A) lauroyltransferase